VGPRWPRDDRSRRISAKPGAATCRAAAFTLVELIIVITIIGILAAIAIPRFSRGSTDAGDVATLRDQATLQRQIDLYAAEHLGVFPAYAGDGSHSAHTAESFLAQMREYSNLSGATNATRQGAFVFGPYLRGDLPALKVGPKAGKNGIRVVTGATAPAYSPGADAGWVYNDTTGQIVPNRPSQTQGGQAQDLGGADIGGGADLGHQ